MELPLLIAMLTFGVLLAAGVVQLVGRARKDVREGKPPGRDVIESALLEAVAASSAPAGRGVQSIDICSWAAAYARNATAAERLALLERAAGNAVGTNLVLPLTQYEALLELAFGLGFHPDALARLRQRYGFDYVDQAKKGRPRSADRAGRAALFRSEEPGERERLLGILGLGPEASRGEIVTAWRRLAAESHPDRFHASGGEERENAAAQFIALTETCERLLILIGGTGRVGRNHP